MSAHPKHFEIVDLIPGEAAFKAYGKTLPELFSNAGLALFSVMVELSTVEAKTKRSVDLTSPKLENLLIDFLSELVYLKDAEGMLFSRFEIQVVQGKECVLHGLIYGEPIDSSKHALGIDVKGVTLHRYEFAQLPDGYQAQIVLDV